jgi:4-hydroxyacetophenone monooxygenase
MRNDSIDPAGEAARTIPITEDDETIRAMLRDAHIPTLLATLAHLTGDTGILAGPIRPAPYSPGDVQGRISPTDQETAREMGLAALAAYRDAGCPPPPPVSEAAVLDIITFLAGEDIPPEYVGLLLEEMHLHDEDTRRLVWSEPGFDAAATGFHVAIIGAGVSGVLMALRLRQAGIPFIIFEKDSEVGGTWFENTYPGCRVDNQSHFYSYSFSQKIDWTHTYSTQPDLLAYVQATVAEHGLREFIRFSTEVCEARHDDQTGLWTLSVDGPGGLSEIRANVLVSATGQLNRPRLPEIDGVEDFAGATLHTGSWNSAVDLKGKRVGVIGTGASAMQLVPEIAKDVGALTLFQRSPPWILPSPKYHDPVPDGQKWLLAKLPYYSNWHRGWLFWTLTDAMLPLVTLDPAWKGNPAAINIISETLRQRLTHGIEQALAGRPDLIAQCVPGFPPLGKRPLCDNGAWYETLKRPNVRLVSEPIAKVMPSGAMLSDGTSFDFDVLIFATGFAASEFFGPMRIIGRDGIDLREHWRGDARAYLGVTIPTLPNFFCLYGPNVNIVHGGSMIFMSECGVRYITESIKLLIEKGYRSMEPRLDVHDRYNDNIDAANEARAWGIPTVSGWYKNAKGRVSQCWPLRFVDYWQWTHEVTPGDYIFTAGPHDPAV